MHACMQSNISEPEVNMYLKKHLAIKIICMQYYDLILIEKLHGIFVVLKMDLPHCRNN